MSAICQMMNCPYYYTDEDENHPTCHFPDDDTILAPCEEEDEKNGYDEPYDIDDDCGYDPYLGCFSDDC